MLLLVLGLAFDSQCPIGLWFLLGFTSEFVLRIGLLYRVRVMFSVPVRARFRVRFPDRIWLIASS